MRDAELTQIRLLGITPKNTDDAAPPPPPAAPSLAAIREALAALDAQLRALYAALPARAALVIFTGHDDPRRMAALGARKAAFEGALKSGKGVAGAGAEGAEGEGGQGEEVRWTSADGRALEEEVEKARRGLLFLGVKT